MAYFLDPRSLNSISKFLFKHVEYFSRAFLQFLIAILVLTFCLTVLPLSLIFLIPLKFCVYICAKAFRPDLLHFLSGQSSLLAQEKIGSKPKLNMCVYIVFDGRIEIERLRSTFERRVIQKVRKQDGRPLYPELKQYWVSFLNYTFWKKDKDFDLKNHVKLFDEGYCAEFKSLKLPRCEEDLRGNLGPLIEKPWKAGRSPWELLLIQNFKSEESPPNQTDSKSEKSVLIFRTHHAMCDGYSLLKLVLKDLMLVPPKFKMNFKKMGPFQKFILYSILPLKMPWDMAGSLMRSIDGFNCWKQSRGNPLQRSVWTGFSKPIDVDLIKKIKNKYGVGYNAVLCAAAAGSCQKLMENARQKMPPEITCLIPFPLPGHPDGLVNHATFDFVKWPMVANEKHVERLRMISTQMTPSKYYTAPLGFSLLGNSCLPFLPNIILKFREFTAFTVFLTTLPAPETPTEFNGLGVKAIDVFGNFGPGTGSVGTTMCLVSFGGKQRFALNLDKSLFSNPALIDKFGDYVEEELKLLWHTKLKDE